MPRISAGVVMYGGGEEARRCIDSIYTQTKQPVDVYLMDNASPDDALAAFGAGGLPGAREGMPGAREGMPEGLTVLPQRENRGYGAGHNAVLPLLRSTYHAVVNPDIVLNEDALGEMAAWMDAHPDVAITTPHLVFPDGRDQFIAKRRPALLPLLSRQLGIGALKKYEDHYLMLDEDLSKPIDVEFCSGSFFLIRTDIFQKIGGFDEKYFMYVEDADITQKALAHGRAVYLPQVTVTHAWHRAAHKNPRQFLWQTRSMLRYFGKWGFKMK